MLLVTLVSFLPFDVLELKVRNVTVETKGTQQHLEML